MTTDFQVEEEEYHKGTITEITKEEGADFNNNLISLSNHSISNSINIKMLNKAVDYSLKLLLPHLWIKFPAIKMAVECVL